MIFSIEGHIEKIINGTKTMTRRPTDRYKVGKLYAIQPGRTKKGIPDGKIYVSLKEKEIKSILNSPSKLANEWHAMEMGYPIREWEAKFEGGYTSEEFEALYEEMYLGWTERWSYYFMFFSAKDLEELYND